MSLQILYMGQNNSNHTHKNTHTRDYTKNAGINFRPEINKKNQPQSTEVKTGHWASLNQRFTSSRKENRAQLHRCFEFCHIAEYRYIHPIHVRRIDTNGQAPESPTPLFPLSSGMPVSCEKMQENDFEK